MTMSNSPQSSSSPPSTRPSPSWSIPAPLKRLFDKFPLVTYAENDLPARSVRLLGRDAREDIHAFYDAHERKHSIGGQKGSAEALHAFFSWAGEGEASPMVASFHPGCLRWQAYLVFQGIKFHVVPSNNHASFPSSLPLVASHPDAGPPFVQPVITSDGLSKWARKNENVGTREDVYMSLIDGPIRRAWLYHMYLTPNFEKLTIPCYITPQSTSPIIRLSTAHSLRVAAETDLLKQSPKISEHTIYLEAEEAFKALSIYLKERLDAGRAPISLLDAAVFSYVYLLLELREEVWEDKRLVDLVGKFGVLRTHRDVIRKKHFRARPPGLWKELNAAALSG